MSKRRYLTKSRFKLALECPAKLYYTDKHEYANQKLEDSILVALAEGGFQIGELAKLYFRDGVNITTLDYDEALTQTNKHLGKENVVIYEAAIAVDNLFIRADILIKKGDRLELYEVKSKSFDSSNKNIFSNKDGTIPSNWQPYLYDVAFQKYVINRAFPQYSVSAYLIMADKTAICPTDGLNQKFQLRKDGAGKKYVCVSNQLTDSDLTLAILKPVSVDAECDIIFAEKYSYKERDFSFSEMVNQLAAYYALDKKIDYPISSKCAKCEFYTTLDDELKSFKSGKKECLKKMLGWSDEDCNCPTVLDIWNFRKKDKLINSGVIKLSDVTKEKISPESDLKPGLSVSERQWLQVEKYRQKDFSVWVDRENLLKEMKKWVFPLHFIDFETTTVAIPFNKGRRPYEGVAFQFSHHIIYENGKIEHHGEYLNIQRGVFPNYDFLRALKSELDKDSGSIFRYAAHENSYLNLIYRQLQNDIFGIEDKNELCEFIKTITKSTKDSVECWEGNRNMIDMLELLKRYYYDPATNGSNSLKQVLPTMLNSSKYLREKYSKPIYGAADGIKSHNFKNWQWIQYDNGNIIDPYKLLPKMFADITNENMQILLSESDELNEGGAASTAYARMQFEEMSDYEREEIKHALLKYCELDTMAMVMIYEAWKNRVK
jgi:hypothetical protein